MRPKLRLSNNGFAIQRSIATFGIKGTGAGTIDSGNVNICNLGTPVSSGHGTSNYYDIPFSFLFRMDQLVNYTEITAIADRYKITKAAVLLTTANSVNLGQVCTYIEYNVDHDDAAVPGISDQDQKLALKTKGFNQMGMCRISCSPRPVNELYPGTGTVGYGIYSRAPWIDCANPAVPHYGIKGIIRNVSLVSASSFQGFSVRVRLTVMAKDLQ